MKNVFVLSGDYYHSEEALRMRGEYLKMVFNLDNHE